MPPSTTTPCASEAPSNAIMAAAAEESSAAALSGGTHHGWGWWWYTGIDLPAWGSRDEATERDESHETKRPHGGAAADIEMCPMQSCGLANSAAYPLVSPVPWAQ
eukprot:jgi/Tetstr1/431989/TSEL_021466.t1